MGMVNTFKAKFSKKQFSGDAESITVKFELSLMSESSVQACAKIALGNKCNVNPDVYRLESIIEI